jgi:hypothetical protein
MRCAAAFPGIGAVAAVLVACAPPLASRSRDPASGTAGAAIAACPRDARPDDHGRCACDAGDVLVLGACVPPPVADAYCGPVGKATASGACAFPVCAADEAVDVDAGCTPLLALLDGGPRSCGPGGSLVVEDRRRVCIPAGAACPRGSQAQGGTCTYAPGCPPGSLPDAGGCRAVVLRGAHGARLVDLGAWAALVLGVDGGPASSDLCRPLEAHPLALGRSPGDDVALRLHVTLSAPGSDVTRVSAEVRAQGPATSQADPVHAVPLPSSVPAFSTLSALSTLAERAVASLIEPLRGLGGETTAARVDVDVHCRLKSPAGAKDPPE